MRSDLGPLTPNPSLGGSSCVSVSVAQPMSSPTDNGLMSPSSPSQCGAAAAGMTAGVTAGAAGEEVWRGSSIASLRRRAFEHSGISMSVFR